MKHILVVSRYKSQFEGHVVPFVREQGEALQRMGYKVTFVPLRGNYVRAWQQLRKAIREHKPDVVHAHYGLMGLVATLQHRVPVVTTYHGSDINLDKVRWLSRIAIRRSAWNIFVSKGLLSKVRPLPKRVERRQNYSVIPCGVDLIDLQMLSRGEARERLGIAPKERMVLFAGGFDVRVKNATLAKQVIAKAEERIGEVRLQEMKGLSRADVTLYMCAADALLMTSHTEGSPQVIKEALAAGCPIVSVEVGDVRERVAGVDGCYVSAYSAPHGEHEAKAPSVVEDMAALLVQALGHEGKTKGRERVERDGLDNAVIARQIGDVYEGLRVGNN